MTIEQLAARKYDLRDSLEDKIRQLKLVHYRESQPSLFEDATIDPEINFVFAHGRYTPNRYCERQDWQKHFFPVVGWLDSGEETDCARTIDQHPNVKTWIRNLVQRPESFRLPKPSGHYFYPDFLVQLKSEKFVIVEYKGEGYYDGAADAREVGELWEKRSRGLCRFVMPRGYRLNEVEAALN